MPPPCEIWMNLTYICSFAMLRSAILIKMEMFFSHFVGVAIHNPHSSSLNRLPKNVTTSAELICCTSPDKHLRDLYKYWGRFVLKLSPSVCFSRTWRLWWLTQSRAAFTPSVACRSSSLCLHSWITASLPARNWTPLFGNALWYASAQSKQQAGGFLHCAFVNKQLQTKNSLTSSN